jgi:hypothetical protein
VKAVLGLQAGVLAAIVGTGCSHPSDADLRFPPRPEGCDVQVFPETPNVAVENIGPVHARCAQDLSDDACLRTLKDTVCKMGGDVVWGIGDAPTVKNDEKKHWNGRAAHTKAPGTPAK